MTKSEKSKRRRQATPSARVEASTPRTLSPESSLDAPFSRPTKVDDVLIAFPGNVRHLMPEWDAIPEKYRRGHTGHAASLFFLGGRVQATAKDGIDAGEAMRHVRCILGSYQPKHEHKEAAVDYLIDRWFDSFEVLS